MLPVVPNLESNLRNLDIDHARPEELPSLKPFAVYMSTQRLMTLPRPMVNTRIVVVGASDTALSFLETLIFTYNKHYHLCFNNVTLISPHGFIHQEEHYNSDDLMFVHKSNLTYRRIEQLCFHTYVNVVTKKMIGIDRKRKKVVLNDHTHLNYDLLFIMCGEQFQRPKFVVPVKQRIKTDAKIKEDDRFPSNVFMVNSPGDASRALKATIQSYRKSLMSISCNVIVYGFCLEAYCCVNTLLTMGIPGSFIFFAIPVTKSSEKLHLHQDGLLFNNEDVEDAIDRELEQQSVRVLYGYYLQTWNVNVINGRITSATFISKHQQLEIQCLVLYAYDEKRVSFGVFHAISRSGLVFDGQLVIDPEYKTNDPNIYAAGTMTKYSRKYYADHRAPKYFNAHEIGRRLALQVRDMYVPVEVEEKPHVAKFDCEDNDKKSQLPVYKEPVVTHCTLPGNIHYLQISQPGKPTPLTVAMGSDDYGTVFVTGNPCQLKEKGYFRLHLNDFNCVETITCLSKSEIDIINMTYIWGKHETFLNNLRTRFNAGLITDFYTYFREAWTCALYNAQFSDLLVNTYDVLCSYSDEPNQSVIEHLMELYKYYDYKPLPPEIDAEIMSRFIDSPYDLKIRKKTINFLGTNIEHLPMYAHPFLVKLFLDGYEKSPLFTAD